MSFFLREHYGYTEQEIGEFIETYGIQWVYSAYRSAKEKDYTDKSWLLNISQASQTPQTKKGAKALQKYVNRLQEALERQVPWLEVSKPTRSRVAERMKKPPQPRLLTEGLSGVDTPSDIAKFLEKANKNLEKQ